MLGVINMDNNLVKVKTIIDYDQTEQEFRNVLTKLNKTASIKLKIEDTNTSAIDSFIDKLNSAQNLYKTLTSLPNAGRKLKFCFSAH